MFRQRSRRPWRGAFTLIELLVVVAIVAILAAILFPVFVSAREKGRQTACASNVRQIALAALMYAGDYDDTLPLYDHSDSLTYWVGGRDAAGQPLDKTRGLVYPYIKNGDLQRCPSYTGGEHLGGAGYGVNARLVRRGLAPDPAPLAALSRPAETVLFGDAGLPHFPRRGEVGETILLEPPSAWNFGRPDDPLGAASYPSVSFRHGGSGAGLANDGLAVLAWADGHAKPLKIGAFVAPLPADQRDPSAGLRWSGDLLMARR